MSQRVHNGQGDRKTKFPREKTTGEYLKKNSNMRPGSTHLLPVRCHSIVLIRPAAAEGNGSHDLNFLIGTMEGLKDGVTLEKFGSLPFPRRPLHDRYGEEQERGQ